MSLNEEKLNLSISLVNVKQINGKKSNRVKFNENVTVYLVPSWKKYNKLDDSYFNIQSIGKKCDSCCNIF